MRKKKVLDVGTMTGCLKLLVALFGEEAAYSFIEGTRTFKCNRLGGKTMKLILTSLMLMFTLHVNAAELSLADKTRVDIIKGYLSYPGLSAQAVTGLGFTGTMKGQAYGAVTPFARLFEFVDLNYGYMEHNPDIVGGMAYWGGDVFAPSITIQDVMKKFGVTPDGMLKDKSIYIMGIKRAATSDFGIIFGISLLGI